jgi:hypothetical protein
VPSAMTWHAPRPPKPFPERSTWSIIGGSRTCGGSEGCDWGKRFSSMRRTWRPPKASQRRAPPQVVELDRQVLVLGDLALDGLRRPSFERREVRPGAVQLPSDNVCEAIQGQGWLARRSGEGRSPRRAPDTSEYRCELSQGNTVPSLVMTQERAASP